MMNSFFSLAILVVLSACLPSAEIDNGSHEQGIFSQTGVASFYGPGFHGGSTASDERFDMYDMTAAHPSLEFGTRICVTETEFSNSVEVRINDRGPYEGGRILDLSEGAMRKLNNLKRHLTNVTIRTLGDGESCGAAALAKKACKDSLRAVFLDENRLYVSVNQKCPATKATVKLASTASEASDSVVGLFQNKLATDLKETTISLTTSQRAERSNYTVARIYLQKNSETFHVSNPSPELPAQTIVEDSERGNAEPSSTNGPNEPKD